MDENDNLARLRAEILELVLEKIRTAPAEDVSVITDSLLKSVKVTVYGLDPHLLKLARGI